MFGNAAHRAELGDLLTHEACPLFGHTAEFECRPRRKLDSAPTVASCAAEVMKWLGARLAKLIQCRSPSSFWQEDYATPPAANLASHSRSLSMTSDATAR
jgi:hypothetical protein